MYCRNREKQMDSNKNIKRVALYGGSFNPIHNGHVELLTLFTAELALDRCLLMPTATPPHKDAEGLVSAEHRYAMCKLAVRNMPKVQVSDIEIKRQGKSYTIDTLKAVHALYPKATLYLLMGADMFLSLHTWKNYRQILQQAVVCTIPRNADDIEKLLAYEILLQNQGGKTYVINRQVTQVSSTQVRNAVKNGQDISPLVPKDVVNYIEENKLYRG